MDVFSQFYLRILDLIIELFGYFGIDDSVVVDLKNKFNTAYDEVEKEMGE